MQSIADYYAKFADHIAYVIFSPLFPNSRIFLLYLITSLILAYYVYRKSQRAKSETKQTGSSFLKFLFPKHVWENPSAWLDIRYFFFHQLIGHFFMIGLTAWAAVSVFGYITGGVSIIEAANSADKGIVPDLVLATTYMFVTILAIDFISFVIHFLQHKIPLLWEFHKVHHSLEVMHPISNFREHPVDNFLYNFFTGLGFGMTMALTYMVVGYLPSMPSLLGVPLLMFGFNIVGYNLRHSHVWLRWPGIWSKVFPSPAHHHVHHSCHPDHIDKNFAFLFPVWDVIFKTYTVPEDNKDVKFGLGGSQGKELTSCLRLYFIPVRDAYRLMRKSAKRATENTAKAPPVAERAP